MTLCTKPSIPPRTHSPAPSRSRTGAPLRQVWAATACLALLPALVCCTRPEEPLVIWTDNASLVSYAEAFNAAHADSKAVVLYREHSFRSLPPAKDEQEPDLVIASWLKNSDNSAS